MKFSKERLIQARESLGINKAEAARRLNMSAMGYGRYEKGNREPSFQTVSYIAEVFGTTSDFLYSLSDIPSSDTITVSEEKEPELFALVTAIRKDNKLAERLLEYSKLYFQNKKPRL